VLLLLLLNGNNEDYYKFIQHCVNAWNLSPKLCKYKKIQVYIFLTLPLLLMCSTAVCQFTNKE